MVLWEITLGTAYFLGLKRTYRLALKIQRRLIAPKYPKIRQFAQRRTRYAFDMALKVHKNIQERDLEAGRNLGNWILRWLDRMKPSANIRGTPPSDSANVFSAKPPTNSSYPKKPKDFQRFGARRNQDSGRHMFTLSKRMWPEAIPSIASMIRPTNRGGGNIQYRQFSGISCPINLKGNSGRLVFDSVIRKDILQWIQQVDLFVK